MIDKNIYISDLSKLSGISKERLLGYTMTRPITDVIQMPMSIDPGSQQLKQLNAINNIIINYNILNGISKSIETDLSEIDAVKYYFFNALKFKKDREISAIALFDNEGQLIKISRITAGDLATALVPKRVIISEVISNDAKKILLVHNHPSGMPEPSREDLGVTEAISVMCKALSVEFLDHVIVGDTMLRLKEHEPAWFSDEVPSMKGLSDNFDSICNLHIEKTISQVSEITHIDTGLFETYLSSAHNEKERMENFFSLLNEDSAGIENFMKQIPKTQGNRLVSLSRLLTHYEYFIHDKKIMDIDGPNIAIDFFRSLLNEKERTLIIAYLSIRNRVITWDICHDEINFGEIIKKAVVNHAGAIILGGNVMRNYEKFEMTHFTQKFVDALVPIGIKVLDYINYDVISHSFQSSKASGCLTDFPSGYFQVENLALSKDSVTAEDELEFEL